MALLDPYSPAPARPRCARTRAHLDRCKDCAALTLRDAAPAITRPAEALACFEPIRRKDREHFAVLLLDSRNRPLGFEIVAKGGLNVSAIQPVDVFRPALLANACAVIVGHNHPTGDPSPSPEDLAVTRHLCEAARLLGIQILDHLVLSPSRFRSLREEPGAMLGWAG